MAQFKHYDDNQTSMVVINDQDQLQPGGCSYFCVTRCLEIHVAANILTP